MEVSNEAMVLHPMVMSLVIATFVPKTYANAQILAGLVRMHPSVVLVD